MGHMKDLKVGLIVLGVFFMLAVPVKAMEGTVRLGSKEGKMGSCFATSVFFEGRYRVLMTCRGLRAAFDPIRNKYVAWVKKGENLKRLGELVNGKMRASVDQEFEKIVITAEEDGYANKPKGEALLTGKVEEIVFEGVEMPKEEVVKEIDETGDKGPISTSGKVGTGASVFKVLGKALLTGFLVLLGVVGVLSYLSRRKK